MMKSIQYELPINNQIGDVFRRMRNYLAGRVLGITRDRSLLHEVVKCLFCKVAITQDTFTAPSETGDTVAIAKLYRSTFSKLRKQLDDIFSDDEELLLDPTSLAYVDLELSKLNLTESDDDPLGILYQTFISSDLRMAEGQFFTPQEAIRWVVEAVTPKSGQRIIDPACGTGGFLNYAARYLVRQGVPKKLVNECIFGIEKDQYLSQLAKTRIALVTLMKPNVVCGDSIEGKTIADNHIPFDMYNSFDIVLTNPPFGAKIITGSSEARRRFDLAYNWRLDKKSGEWFKTTTQAPRTPPQILFLELSLKLLREGGIMGIVVPESMISTSSRSYVVNYLTKQAMLISIIGMPESLFKTSGKGGTHTKTCLLVARKKSEKYKGEIDKHIVFMAEAKWCGHDSRGNQIPNNDLPLILENFKKGSSLESQDHLGYLISNNKIIGNILAPRYYDPEPTEFLNELSHTHELISVGQLVRSGVLSFSTGDEIGKLAYGTGMIPFVRTSDISNWEIKIDPKQNVSEEIYLQYKDKQDVREGDILMVRDGTYLIGNFAYISKYDVRMVYQSHMYKIRVEKPEVISPFLLLAILSSEPVARQIKAKRFTQDIIDSLGRRVYEIVLPIPKEKERQDMIANIVRKSINDRIEARELARKATQSVVDG